MGFSCIYSPDGLNNTLLSPCFILVAPSLINIEGTFILRTREGVGSLRLPWSSLRVNWRSCLLRELLQQELQGFVLCNSWEGQKN